MDQHELRSPAWRQREPLQRSRFPALCPISGTRDGMRRSCKPDPTPLPVRVSLEVVWLFLGHRHGSRPCSPRPRAVHSGGNHRRHDERAARVGDRDGVIREGPEQRDATLRLGQVTPEMEGEADGDPQHDVPSPTPQQSRQQNDGDRQQRMGVGPRCCRRSASRRPDAAECDQRRSPPRRSEPESGSARMRARRSPTEPGAW